MDETERDCGGGEGGEEQSRGEWRVESGSKVAAMNNVASR